MGGDNLLPPKRLPSRIAALFISQKTAFSTEEIADLAFRPGYDLAKVVGGYPADFRADAVVDAKYGTQNKHKALPTRYAQ